MIVTPEQIRAARALLRLEQSDLARRAQVSVVTIRRLEAASPTAPVAQATLDAVRQVLEQSGAKFIPNGVMSRRLPPSDRDALFARMKALSLRSAERQRGADQMIEADLYDENGMPA